MASVDELTDNSIWEKTVGNQNPVDNLYVCPKHDSNKNYAIDCFNCATEIIAYRKFIKEQIQKQSAITIEDGPNNVKSALRSIVDAVSDERRNKMGILPIQN